MASRLSTQNIGNALGIGGLIAFPILMAFALWRSAQVKAAISQHPHGSHDCYCPTCGYKMEVGPDEKCRDQYCPQDGTRMRAVETGERRG